MAFHISLDGGGTKVKALLYDDEFHLISRAAVGSTRANTTAQALRDQNHADLLAQLFDGHPYIKQIASVHGVAEHGNLEAIEGRCPIARRDMTSEGSLALAAAGICGEGFVCLSGTGSAMFYVDPEGRTLSQGGYGAAVYDEGSGYHIGRMACAAAICYDEDRGTPTILRDMIAAHFGVPGDLGEAISRGVYENETRSPVAAVAGLAPVVSRAAALGDQVSLAILRRAGQALGQQMNTLIRRTGREADVPLTVSGSVFRGHLALYESLCETILAENPQTPVARPRFEPVVGGILTHWFRLGRAFDPAAQAFFAREYQDYIFTIGA